MKKKNTFLPLLFLLAIPVTLVIDIVLLCLASWIDFAVIPDPNAVGHPVPILTFIYMAIVPIISLVIFIVFTLLAVIGVIINLVKNNKLKKAMDSQNVQAFEEQKTMAEQTENDIINDYQNN